MGGVDGDGRGCTEDGGADDLRGDGGSLVEEEGDVLVEGVEETDGRLEDAADLRELEFLVLFIADVGGACQLT